MPLTNETVNHYFAENRTLCSLLYGGPGVGKTLLAASAQKNEELADVAFVDADPGLVSLVGFDDKIVKIGFDQVKELLSLPRYLKATLPNVKTIVFDTIPAVAGKRLTELSDAGYSSGKRGQDELQIQDYKVVTGNIEKLVATMRSAGYSVIMTAGVKDEMSVSDDGKPVLKERRADLPPELARRMNHIADHIWHLYLGADGSYNVLFRPMNLASGAVIQAKTRNFKFTEALGNLAKTRPGNPNAIKIGQVGDDPNKYPNLNTFYKLLTEAIDN